MNKKLKNKNGITLVSLVITIVIMLILAGVSISFIIGQNGLFTKSQSSSQMYKNASDKEQNELNSAESTIDNELALTKEKTYKEEMLEYPIITKNGVVNAKRVNEDDETDFTYILDKTKQCTAADALDVAAYDGDESTYANPSSGRTKFYFGDDIDIYDVCFKVEGEGKIYECLTYGNIWNNRTTESAKLDNGYYHTIYYGKGSTSWRGIKPYICLNTYEIMYDANVQ